MLKNLIYVALGGAIGASLRFLISIALQQYSINGVYISIILVNLLGSLGLGIFSEYISKVDISEELSLLISVGIFGALTTFSTFSKEAIDLIEDNKLFQALLYILISVIFGILMFYIGKLIFSRIIN